MFLKKELEDFSPFDEEEKTQKEYLLKWINTFDDVLTRDNIFGHFTSSALVVNKERTKMVVVYHNIFDGWILPGGHVDGDENFLSVAMREVEEETGLKTKVIEESIFGVSSSPIVTHLKKGKWIPSHTHLDVFYLLEADDKIPLIIKEDENKGVKWINLSDAYNDDIVYFIRPVHKRLIRKMKSLNL